MLNKNATCGYDSTTDNHAHSPFGKSEDLQRKGDELPKAPVHLDGSEYNRILRVNVIYWAILQEFLYTFVYYTIQLQYKRSYENNDVIRGPYNANKHSSYVELVIVVDNKLYKSFGENSKKVHQHCKDLANIINAVS